MARRAKTVAVYSGSGGVGRTFIATNLAVALQQHVQGRVLIIDAHHPMPGDTHTYLGLDRVKSFADMVPILDQLTPELFASYVTPGPAHTMVAALATDVLQARLLTPSVIGQLLDVASFVAEIIVLDMPTGAAPLSSTLFERTDDVVVVMEPTPLSVTRTRPCLDYLRSLQIPYDCLLLCVNKSFERGALAVEKLEELLGCRVVTSVPQDLDTIIAAAKRREPVVVAHARHAMARDIDRLAREIAARGMRQQTTADAVGDEFADSDDVREVRLRMHRRLVDEIDLRKADLAYLRDPVKLQELKTRAEAKVLMLLDEEASHIRDRGVRRRIVKQVLDEALGLGPLEDLLADPTVTEIMVNRHDQIYVERAGKLQLTDVRFLTTEQLRGVIERIVAPIGRRIDEKVPMVDARLKDGSRVNAIIPPLALKGPALTIRKFSKKLLGMEDLKRYGSLTEQMGIFLGAAVQARLNVVISGGTGSGKTTLLNLLSSFIPDDERIVTIEDSAELQLSQAHVITLESRPPNIEGEGAITIRDLVKNSLRMRPDRIVVGECRSGEALDMLQAMNTGHDGSLTTVHANTPRDALSRLETMSLMAGLDLPSRAIRDQIASAINLVVQQSRLQDGSRRITHITEVSGMEGNVFTTADIFVFRQTGLSPEGKVYGQFVPTGYVPAFVDAVGRRGIKVPREIFLHQTA